MRRGQLVDDVRIAWPAADAGEMLLVLAGRIALAFGRHVHAAVGHVMSRAKRHRGAGRAKAPRQISRMLAERRIAERGSQRLELRGFVEVEFLRQRLDVALELAQLERALERLGGDAGFLGLLDDKLDVVGAAVAVDLLLGLERLDAVNKRLRPRRDVVCRRL